MLKVRGRGFSVARRDIVPLVVMGLLLSLSSLSLFLSYNNYMEAGIASTLLFVYPIMVAVIRPSSSMSVLPRSRRHA